MTTRTLRAGLVGLGHMGRHHARTLRRLEGVDLAAAVDPAGDPHDAAEDTPVFADIDQMLRRGIDYAVLACPTSLHADMGVRLANAGIPTLIEKPLAGDRTSAHRLTRAFENAGVPAAIGYIERFNPALAALHARLQDDLLGDVFEISTRRTGTYPARITDVGVIDDLATHDFDLTAWLTGQQYTSITARTSNRSGRLHEDLLAAIAQLANGTIAQHRVNWLTPVPERVITVTGEHGCLIADTITNQLTFCPNGAARPGTNDPSAYCGVTRSHIQRFEIPRKDPLLSEHRAFRETVLGGDSPGAGLDAGMHAVLVAHAASVSARTALTVPVHGLSVQPCGRIKPRRQETPNGNGRSQPGSAPRSIDLRSALTADTR